MPQYSAGILLFRRRAGDVELLLVHPGGPFWRHKDDGAWSIPKGLYDKREDPLMAAKREFQEEVGSTVEGDFIDLGAFKQPSGKIVTAFAVEGELDLATFKSNTFELEWPAKSGRRQSFPEADRADWFAPDAALRKITKGQVPIVRALIAELAR
jgi:predicted NUDIX family NTP pyrophosphohydrolase